MEFKYAAIVICLIFVIFLSVKESRRVNKARLIWRLSASVVSVLCFILMLLPLRYQVQNEIFSNEIALLTPGTSADSVGHIKKVNKYTSDPLLFNANKRFKVNFIPDLLYFLKTNKEIQKINVYGYGLSEDQLQELSDYQLNFHPEPEPAGIISCNWNRKLKNTESLLIQGSYYNPHWKSVKLLLHGLGTDLDSITIKPQTKTNFSFNNQPKQSGKAIYNLIAVQDRDTITDNAVAFEVVDALPMKVMILSSYPDFEYKFLKNWLFENQYPVVFRSRISKNKYSTDYLNMESIHINNITNATLRNIDLLMIDEEELSALNTAERTFLNKEVEKGMGLFVRVTDIKTNTAYTKSFNLYESDAQKNKPLSIEFPDVDKKFNPLPLEQALFIRSGMYDQPLVTGSGGKILVNSRVNGMGKILISSLPATYQWLLSGNSEDYTAFWSALFKKAARKKARTGSWQIIPAISLVGQRTTVVIEQASDKTTPKIEVNDMKLSPRQNLELDFQWDALFWPTKAGWNTISINNITESFYSYETNDWKSIINYKNINSTVEFIKNNQNYLNSKQNIILQEKEVSKWWFFIAFLCATGFLWYETRILGNN